MSNEPQRHARLRLARRRPAPTRVRARVSDEPPESEPEASRLQRAWRHVWGAKWAHIITVVGTALAAVAAIGGLWAQAVATYWSQQTAKDQLAQSQDNSDTEQRAQAARVTFWIDERDGLPHFVNTSSDPVSDTAFLVEQEPDGRYVAVYALSPLAPCTETILQFTGVELDIARHIDLGRVSKAPCTERSVDAPVS